MPKKKDNKKQDGVQKFITKVKIKVKKVWLKVSVTVLSSIVPVIALILVAAMIIGILATVVAALFAAMTGSVMNTNNPSWEFGGSNQKPGERYVWNVQDLDLLTDPHLKNIYMHAWLIENCKDITGSNILTTSMLGIPIYESGDSYHTNPDPNKEEDLDISKYASGYTSDNASYRGIYQQYLQYDGVSYYKGLVSAYLKKYGTTEEQLWGTLPHSSTLSTKFADETSLGHIKSYGNNNVMTSHYNLAMLTFTTIGNYMQYPSITQDGDAFGHVYKDAYDKALAAYCVEETEEVKAYVQSAVFYLQHAGGFWGAFSATDDVENWTIARDMMLDYIVYYYVNYKNIEVNIEAVDPKNLNNPDFKQIILGVDNPKFGEGIKYVHGSGTGGSNKMTLDGKPLKTSIIDSWRTYNEAKGNKEYAEMYKYLFDYTGNHGQTVRQAAYALAVGPSTDAIGAARLDAVFNALGKEWVLDYNTGYVCNTLDVIEGSPYGNTGSVSDGAFVSGSTFAETKENITFGTKSFKNVSNVRDSSWFVKLNNSEWCDPLDTKKNGGIKLTSRYGFRNYDNGDWHGGIDLQYSNMHGVGNTDTTSMKKYFPVYAMHDGVITQCVETLGSVKGAGRTLAYKVTYSRNGKQVTRYITYMHLADIADGLKDGVKIKKGQVVGYMGGSGDYEGQYAIHLHLQIGFSSYANSKKGLVDMETELPFVTKYKGYGNSTTGYKEGGYLYKRPALINGPLQQDSQINGG